MRSRDGEADGADIADLLRLLQGANPRLELFRYSAEQLFELYGAAWAADARAMFQQVAAFARRCGEDLAAALASYGEWIERATLERLQAPSGGAAGEPPPQGERSGIHYLYALALSTALNRSRYELFCHYRETLRRHLPAGSRSLEIGAGTCTDAALAAQQGPVVAYETNPLSRRWLEVLDLAGCVDLRIETYRFDEPAAFPFVTMIELLEHVADPGAYLDGAHRVLEEGGLAYLTCAVRMPQFDHLTEFAAVEQCRELVMGHGFALLDERCLVDTFQPFAEADRERLAEDPRHSVIYCCLARKLAPAAPAAVLSAFNLDVD